MSIKGICTEKQQQQKQQQQITKTKTKKKQLPNHFSGISSLLIRLFRVVLKEWYSTTLHS